MDTPDHAARRARGACWAALMQRTFGFDVLACPRCGGRLRLIALIDQAPVIERILRHLGVPTEVPAVRPARAGSSPSVRAPEVCPEARRQPPIPSSAGLCRLTERRMAPQ